jgi:UDP-N-acetylmuramate--alanine ligase
MKVYFSGIGGVGLGPLAEIATDGGYEVVGSDAYVSTMYTQLQSRGAEVSTDQSGEFLEKCYRTHPIDWFVHTSALPTDHPELLKAKQLGIKITKRDVFLSQFIQDKKLRLLAVAGTHGKTTTSGMLTWLFTHYALPISYSVGSTLSFGPSGKYDPNSTFFVYECDEYDRNFLQFFPEVSLIPAYDYDHPDIYLTEQDYAIAFLQFFSQSENLVLWSQDAQKFKGPLLALVENSVPDHHLEQVIECTEESVPVAALPIDGAHNRRNAWLAAEVFGRFVAGKTDVNAIQKIAHSLKDFPGTGRRFEKLADNIYTDYAHHPAEIKATLQMALELNPHVVIVYQPHQNVRQHEIKNDYFDAFEGAQKIYWLPTYLSREKPELHVLHPEELITMLDQPSLAEPADMNDALWLAIKKHTDEGVLVICMGAGTIDEWVRRHALQSVSP